MKMHKRYVFIVGLGFFLGTFSLNAVAQTKIVTQTLPPGKQLTEYTAILKSQGIEPIRQYWKISDGDLPPGLTLETTSGKIFGVPKFSGMYLFTVQLADAQNQALEERDYTIRIQSKSNPAADFDYDGDVDFADKNTFISYYTGPRPTISSDNLPEIEQNEVILKPIEDVFVRNLVPNKSYENDGVSVYENVTEKEIRRGLITFNVSSLKGKSCQGAVLELYNIGSWGGYRFPIHQTVSIVPGRASGANWITYLKDQKPHEQLLQGLRHCLGGSEKGGTYIASTPAWKPIDLAKIQAAIDGDGLLTLLLKQVENGTKYCVDWGDISRIRKPARLRIFINNPPCLIMTTELPQGKINIPYSTYLSASENCGKKLEWKLTAGSLPDGLALNSSTGHIQGKPRFAGTYPIRVKLSDPALNVNREVDLSLTVESVRADFDQDGDVDQEDLAIFKESFTGPLDLDDLSISWRKFVIQCLDTLIEHGRDVYGPIKTPMLMAVIDVRTLQAPENPDLYDSYIRTEGRPTHGRRSPGGCNLWLDMPTLRTMYHVSKITGNAKYAQAADDYIQAVFKYAVKPNGLLYWGSHSYYHAYRDKYGGDGYHEILILHPEWQEMYRLNPQAVRREVDGIWKWHIIDPETGDSNRHDDKGATGRGSFGFSSGSYAIAFSFMYSVTKEKQYLEKAKKVADWHWRHRHPETNLASDTHGPRHPAGAAGTHTSQLLRCYELTGDSYFRDIAFTYIKAYEKYGWDEQARTYWGMLELDGTHLAAQPPDFKLEDPAGYWYPTGHVALWRTLMFPYEFPLIAAQASIYAYELSSDEAGIKDPELLKTALHWAEAIEKQLPPQSGRRWKHKLEEALPDVRRTGGTYAENYGRAISFFVHLYQATKNTRYLYLARNLAREAVEKLYENGLFKGHPAKPYYETNDGVGFLLFALLELDEPGHDFGGAF